MVVMVKWSWEGDLIQQGKNLGGVGATTHKV